MIEAAQNLEIPNFIELVYHIDKEQSQMFWNDKSLQKEHDMLLMEWESPIRGMYKKTMYGIRFAIQFEYGNS